MSNFYNYVWTEITTISRIVSFIYGIPLRLLFHSQIICIIFCIPNELNRLIFILYFNPAFVNVFYVDNYLVLVSIFKLKPSEEVFKALISFYFKGDIILKMKLCAVY